MIFGEYKLFVLPKQKAFCMYAKEDNFRNIAYALRKTEDCFCFVYCDWKLKSVNCPEIRFRDKTIYMYGDSEKRRSDARYISDGLDTIAKVLFFADRNMRQMFDTKKLSVPFELHEFPPLEISIVQKFPARYNSEETAFGKKDFTFFIEDEKSLKLLSEFMKTI